MARAGAAVAGDDASVRRQRSVPVVVRGLWLKVGAACRLAVLSGLSLTLAAAGEAVGQIAPQPQVPPGPQAPGVGASPSDLSDLSWLEPQLKLLDSDDLKTRERATAELKADGRLSLAALQARIADTANPLTAEQSLRLSEVALKLFRESPRAAMGVSFTQRPVQRGVEIGAPVEGFDSWRVIKPGDLILEMDGMPVLSYDDARAAIISHDPGEEMAVTILRGGEVIEAAVRLGEYARLQNRADLNDPILRDAWLVRCERLVSRGQAGKANLPIEAGLNAEQWAAANLAERRASLKRQREDQATPVEARPDDGMGPPAVVGGGSLRRPEEASLIDFSDSDQQKQPERVRQIQAQIVNLQAQVRLFEQQLQNDRNMPEAQRANIQRNIRRYREMIQQYKAERARMLRGNQVEP